MWRPDAEEGRFLLGLARAAIARALGVLAPEPDELLAGALERDVLRRPGAPFVTLRLDGELRGCLGTLEAEEPLARAVARHAVAAALRDPRFPPLTASELEALHLSVSVLGPFTPVGSPEAIVIGRHGVSLVRGPFRSVFLPEVAVEQSWDVATLLEHLARKAGLRRRGDWEDAALAVFETACFAEDERTGAILRFS
ncbi:MAG TPA: AmmeMemoRadiSam system protein A [Candidatus Polarisedimenticolaceae bacterium]|nr:AmmeMemoRadiSam system protein A [Candidatus Polarisedimenticolaceae bacterium]